MRASAAGASGPRRGCWGDKGAVEAPGSFSHSSILFEFEVVSPFPEAGCIIAGREFEESGSIGLTLSATGVNSYAVVLSEVGNTGSGLVSSNR